MSVIRQTPGPREESALSVLPSAGLRKASSVAGMVCAMVSTVCVIGAWQGFIAADHYGVLSNWGMPALLWGTGFATGALGTVLQFIALPWRGYQWAIVVVGFLLGAFGLFLSGVLGLWLLDVWFWAP